MKKIFVGFLLLTVAWLAQARMMRAWTYQQLFDQADLVVIGKAIATHDTSEQTMLVGVSVAGLSTDVQVSAVLKGDKNLKTLILHHYRFSNPNATGPNGPTLVTFDPKKETRHLMFLHRESDGRYEPIGGQEDPAKISILKLDGIAR